MTAHSPEHEHDRRSRAAQPRASATPAARPQRRNLTGYLFIAPWLIAFLAFFPPIAGSALLAFATPACCPSHCTGLAGNFDRMLFGDRAGAQCRLPSSTVDRGAAQAGVRARTAMLLNNSRRLISAYRAAYTQIDRRRERCRGRGVARDVRQEGR
jgi:hypothetical protein